MKTKLPFYGCFSLLLALFSAGLVHAAELPDFQQIVRENSPAVVKIIVEQHADRQGGGQPGPGEIPEELRRFFEFRGAPPSQQERMGLGSGFIVSEDGYVLTNNHVVEGADSVLVRMSDRREFEADIIGTDPRSDLALLRIDASDLPTLRLAKDEDLEVGEWVLAIGSPFGLDYSVSAGIVSAKGRSLPTAENENYVPFIQTDVAINPGNSGGPLFNLDGEVVGVNSQIFTRSGGSIGLSFAIPAAVARNVFEQLKESGRVTRGWLGVTIQDVDKNLAESFGLKRPRGALVAEVSKDSPAERGGLRSGDIVIKFDGKDIPSSSDLPHVVGLVAPGSTVEVEIMRDKSPQTVTVEVGGLDADESYSLLSGKTEGQSGGRLGMQVETLPAESLERYGLNGGVVVRAVAPGSVAAQAGIRVGDVITLIDTSPIKSTEAFEDAVDDLSGGSSVPMRLIRDGSPLFIGLKVPE
ncbi:Periplasmic serine endoprotease DegP [Halioglobus japonicus]|nr:Periplasmic serine endoprotease DegP [Halioglobus japonicus]